MNADRYADLSQLCGITAFSLPPRRPRLPAPGPAIDHHTADLFGPIPDHLLPRYLCYDDPSPPSQLHSSSSSIPYSPSFTTSHPSLLDSPSPCPNFVHDSSLPPPDFSTSPLLLHGSSTSPCDYSDSVPAPPPSETPLLHESLFRSDSPASGPRRSDSPASGPRQKDSLVHGREILPPCVVNYQDSLYPSPERELCSYSAEHEKWIANSSPSEIHDKTLCNPNHVSAKLDSEHLVSVTKDFAFAGGCAKKLPSHIKRLAMWHKDVVLDDRDCEDMASFMTSFTDFSFSSCGRKDPLQEPSRKKQRKHGAKSNGVSSSFHFTRSKSANRLSKS